MEINRENESDITKTLSIKTRLAYFIAPIIFCIMIIMTLEIFAPVCGVEKFRLFDSDLTPHRCLESARWICISAFISLFLLIIALFIKPKFIIFIELMVAIFAVVNILLPIVGTGACSMPSMVCRKHSFPMTNALSVFIILSLIIRRLITMVKKKSMRYSGKSE